MTIRRGPLRLPLPLCRGPLRLPLSLPGLLSAVACAAVVMSGCGSQPSGPIASLTQSRARPATPDLASVTRWWRVPGRPQEVLAWIRAHLPPGFTPAGTGVGTRSGSGSEWWTRMFALPAVPDVLIQRELVVLAVRSGSQTAIRVDAQVVWLPARPVAERVPSAARVLTVTRSSASIPPPAPSASTAPSRSPTRPRWPGSRRSSTA
jgi:hypothetical protein